MVPYPLAHDENGVPLDVPAGAIGWLVRRHTGAKGRPGAVYDEDGRPLLVSLDATAGDLRGHGCKPGHYRLEAVDSGRKPLGLVAFTEVVRSADTPDESGPASNQDAAVAALARAVEAMQRVQAERERVQAEMFSRLIERLAPPPVQPASDFRNMLGQMVDVQKALKKLAPPEPVPESTPEPEAPTWTADVIPVVQQLVEYAGPAASRWLWAKLGLSDEQMNQLGGAMAKVAGAATTPPVKANANAPAAPAPVAAADGDHLQAVLDHLTEAERATLDTVVPKLPADIMEKVKRQLTAVPPEQGAALIRQRLAPFMAGNESKPASKPANGASQ